MKNGYVVGGIAGAIAGVVDGIVSVTTGVIGESIGLWEALPGEAATAYILVLLQAQIAWNIFWGIIIALAFVLVYEKIPGKGVLKGLCFSFIFYLVIADLRTAQINWSVGLHDVAIIWVWEGFWASIAYGLVLGYLYKK